MRRAAAIALLAVSGCGKAPADAVTGAATGAEPVSVDSSLVDLLADLALADARAETTPAPRRAVVQDSLRAVALAIHGVSLDDARDRQVALARNPLVARATYDAVERALTAEPR